MPHPQAKVHRMFELVEPIATVTFSEVPNEAFLALGMRNYWDGYFAGRAAPLGLAPAEVVHAVFYNFAEGEVARHLPWVWGRTTPEEAIAVRERGSTSALRQRIGELADSPGLLRVAALVTHGIGGTEAHVLLALSLEMRPEKFGRIHHLPKPQLAAVVDGLRDRGLLDAAGGFTDAGRQTKERIEALTDELAAPAYDVLSPAELDELTAGLEPIAAAAHAH
jgi:hypothetical protein